MIHDSAGIEGQGFHLPSSPGLTDGQPSGSGWAKLIVARGHLTERVEDAGRLLACGHLQEAEVRFRELRRIALAAHDELLAEVACHNLAIAYRQAGERLAADSWQQQSLAWNIRRSAKQPTPSDDDLARLACDLTGRGGDAFLRRDFNLAETLWLRALAIEEWRGACEGQATDCGNLGLLAAARGHLEEGIRWLRKSLRLHRLMFDECGSGHDLLNLAELFRLQDEFSRAIRLLEQAVHHFDRAGALPLRRLAELRLREVQRIESLAKLDPQLN